MVESFKHDDIPNSFDKEGASSQVADLLLQDYLGKPGEHRSSNSSKGEQQSLSFGFEKSDSGKLSQRNDSTTDFVFASLDATSKRSNISVGKNGSWSLEA
jgi:hypothetical protein